MIRSFLTLCILFHLIIYQSSYSTIFLLFHLPDPQSQNSTQSCISTLLCRSFSWRENIPSKRMTPICSLRFRAAHQWWSNAFSRWWLYLSRPLIIVGRLFPILVRSNTCASVVYLNRMSQSTGTVMIVTMKPFSCLLMLANCCRLSLYLLWSIKWRNMKWLSPSRSS